MQGAEHTFQGGQADFQRQHEIELQGMQDGLQTTLQEQMFTFQEEQAGLDRQLEEERLALQKTVQTGQLDLARKQQAHIEEVERQELELKQKQFKMEIFQSLAQSPEILYFLGQSPQAMSQFNDLFDGAGGGNISGLIQSISATPPTNI